MTRSTLERYSNRSKTWDAIEIERMRTLFEQETPMREMAAMLGRTQESIRAKARKTGILARQRERGDDPRGRD